MILSSNQHSPDCPKAAAAISAQPVTSGKLDALGKATLPGVPPGAYYLMGSAAPGGQPFLWNVRVELRAGATSITLDQRNATPVK